MPRQQEFICGLSHEVAIAVLPRLNMEELIFELKRRIKNLDKETSIKDRLVSILRDVMLEEYRQWERISEVSSPDETTIPMQTQQSQETAIIQENAMTAETSSPDASQLSFELDIGIKKERDISSEVVFHTKAKDLLMDSDQIPLTVSEQDQLCNTPSPASPTIPSSEKAMTQIDTTADFCIKEEDIDMLTGDEAVRACHDELNIQTPTSSTQVLDTQNPMSTSRTEKTVEIDTPSASRHLPPHDGDVHIKTEFHVSDDDQIRQMSQTEYYTNERDTVLIKSGHDQSRKDNSEETPLASYQPTPDQDCENMTSLPQDNDSRLDNKRYLCDVCGFNTTNARYLSKHRKRHKEEKPFMCGECGYRARHKYRLVEHMRTHTSEKPFKCNHCNYNTSHKRYLVEHMKTHSDAEPYICEICDYRTYKKSRIEKHMMSHAGVKPYKCEECEYRATHQSHVIRHMRLHTGERPYSCQECDYKANERAKLNRHMRLKHP
ncbi:zinc finger protein 480-like [Branchiostoma floridae]|uniref:Zinc finger protein 480-like n=1 Tax=Branchiostoma floridae TaxID=7739 RepID=A0A9J7HPP7_BRAFL|nr:zinc finger protein 480-like [Branchiostoma floridae]